jgi:hypothetical protein
MIKEMMDKVIIAAKACSDNEGNVGRWETKQKRPAQMICDRTEFELKATRWRGIQNKKNILSLYSSITRPAESSVRLISTQGNDVTPPNFGDF